MSFKCNISVISSILIYFLISYRCAQGNPSESGNSWDLSETYPLELEVEDELDFLNHTAAHWDPSKEHSTVKDWFTHIANSTVLKTNFTQYFDSVSLDYNEIGTNFTSIWAAFYSSEGFPPNPNERYPKISFSPSFSPSLRTADFVEITFFLHGNASLVLNTTSLTKPPTPTTIATIDKTNSDTGSWETMSFPLHGDKFESVELRAMDHEGDCVIVDRIRLLATIVPSTSSTTLKTNASSPASPTPPDDEMEETTTTETEEDPPTPPPRVPNASNILLTNSYELYAIIIHVIAYLLA